MDMMMEKNCSLNHLIGPGSRYDKTISISMHATDEMSVSIIETSANIYISLALVALN
jgi:hypothetical protein